MIKENYIKFRDALTKQDTKEAENAFTKAYNEAIEVLNKKILSKEQFDMNNDEELYAVLAIFDNMIGLWSEGFQTEAAQVCRDMDILNNNQKIKEMFLLFSYGADAGMELDKFMREYVDLSKVDSEFPMFLVNFADKINELIETRK